MAADRADTVIEVSVKTDEILKWARFLQEIPKRTPRAIANSLNAAGDEILRQSIDYLAEMTGLDAPDVQNAIEVKKATPSNLEWSMDASAITLEESPNWERPWDKPGDKTFQSQQLLKIITSEDHKVCPICEEAAENSPYTPEDINALAAKWKDYTPPYPVEGPRTNLLHPNAVLEGSRFIGYGHVTEMVRAVFSADAVRTETTVGGFTIGPNHPVLTRRGLSARVFWPKAMSFSTTAGAIV